MLFYALRRFIIFILIPASTALGIDRIIYCRTTNLDKILRLTPSNLEFTGFDSYYRYIFHNESCVNSGLSITEDVRKARESFLDSTFLNYCVCKQLDNEQTKFLQSYATQIYLHIFLPGRCTLDPSYGNFINFLFDSDNNAIRIAACKKLSNDEPDEATKTAKGSLCRQKEGTKQMFKYYYNRINSSNPAKTSMAVFKFDKDNLVDIIKNDISGLQVVKVQTKTAKSFDVPLAKELMTSNLLMNNYGRVVRELKSRMNHYCDDYTKTHAEAFGDEFLTYAVRCPNEKYDSVKDLRKTMLYNEIEFAVKIEDYYTVFRCTFIAISCIVNGYMLLTLEGSNKNMEKISVSLIRLLFVSNIIFLITDIWFIVETFFPIIHPGKNYHFVQIPGDFDCEHWSNLTSYVCMESVRMTMDFRVEASDFNMSDPSANGVAIRTLLVAQNTLLNVSRTYAGSINFCVMFFVLYDLRRSYHGFLKSSVLLWFKVVVGSMFVLVTVLYIAAGVLQYFVLNKINQHLKTSNAGGSDE
uniref:G_PROTEIN_RECEP_F1_2 domain-containing protein n=1 Tax=Panagrellus redivivus TaxID=6233 RepID=A0A7E4VFH7_PANRE